MPLPLITVSASQCPAPLETKHFQVAVHQIFLIDSAIDRAPAGHLQLTRDTGDLLRRPGRPQLILYVAYDLLRTEHPPVAVGAPQQILLLCCVRVVCWDVIYMGATPSYFPRHRTCIPADQPGDFAAAQAVHVIFSYTTALFYSGTKSLSDHQGAAICP